MGSIDEYAESGELFSTTVGLMSETFDGTTEGMRKSIVTTTIPFLPLGLGIIIVTVLGILGNLVSAIVLSRERLRSSYSVLTLGLTLADSVYLFTKLLRYGAASAHDYHGTGITYLQVVLPNVGPYLRAITFTAHTASTYFTIAIAVDRFIAVCCPARARKYCTRRWALFIAILVIFWSFIFNATRWLEFETVLVQTNGSSPIYEMKTTELRHHPEYREIYIFWLYFIFMFAIPFVSLCILNMCIFLGVRKMTRDSSLLTSTQRRDASFSIMLIGVVAVFLVCNLDYLVLDILEYCGVAFSEFWNHLGNFMLTLNSAVNFIIYCVCGWKFRDELWKLIRDIFPCLKQHGSHDIAGTDESHWVKSTMDHVDLQTIPRVTLSKAIGKSK